MNAADDDLDVGHDLEITRSTRRCSGAGTCVSGKVSRHLFEALVFPEHADNPEWEIGDSRISKLWVQRLADKREVFNWDRGPDVTAKNELTQAIVDFLNPEPAQNQRVRESWSERTPWRGLRSDPARNTFQTESAVGSGEASPMPTRKAQAKNARRPISRSRAFTRRGISFGDSQRLPSTDSNPRPRG